MEIKKTLAVDLEPRKQTFWLTGLVGIAAILFICFEWTHVSRRSNFISFNGYDIPEEDPIELTFQNNTPPPPPPPPAQNILEQITIVDNDVMVDTEIQSVEVTENDVVEILNETVVSAPVDEEEADGNVIWQIVEKEPEFPGGQAELMKYLNRSIRYPAFVAEQGIQGRVTLSFVVEKDGSVSQITEIRSPSEGLTREAMRVVSSMPKWNPGKQRGKPVRVKFMLPVTFKLQ